MAQQPLSATAGVKASGGTIKPREEPAGVEREAQLLEGLTEIPNIAAAWGQATGDGGLHLTVCIDRAELRDSRDSYRST
jgi:hypothetical protein